MNRLFGKGKAKEPPPNLTDCIANVSDAKILFFNMYMSLSRVILNSSLENFCEIDVNIQQRTHFSFTFLLT